MTHLPPWLAQSLQTTLDRAFSQTNLSNLQTAYNDLKHRYRESTTKTSGFISHQEVLAYTAVRLPATYAVVQRCLAELPPSYTPKSVLDLGAGPGTASLACIERFGLNQLSPLESLTLIEADQDARRIGEQLIEEVKIRIPNFAFDKIKTNYLSQNLTTLQHTNTADLVIASYVFGELNPSQQEQLLLTGLTLCKDYFLIILPGTPQGFEIINTLRTLALQKGLQIQAPCPHPHPCPLAFRSPDWCHFSIRLDRTYWHKRLKQAELPYEDEKFSYLLLSKKPVTPYSNKSNEIGRVIKNPQHRGSHGTIDICSTKGEYIPLTYTRRKSPLFQQLKRLEWGDRWNGNEINDPNS